MQRLLSLWCAKIPDRKQQKGGARFGWRFRKCSPPWQGRRGDKRQPFICSRSKDLIMTERGAMLHSLKGYPKVTSSSGVPSPSGQNLLKQCHQLGPIHEPLGGISFSDHACKYSLNVLFLCHLVLSVTPTCVQCEGIGRPAAADRTSFS